MLVTCGCYGCRRWQTYHAADLAEYFGSNAVVGELFPGCPYCGNGANWRESYRHPNTDDVLNPTMIRKLKGWRRIAIWKNEPYEAPAAKEARPVIVPKLGDD